MNKVARFLFTGFVLLAMITVLSIAVVQSSAKKAAQENSQRAVKIIVAR